MKLFAILNLATAVFGLDCLTCHGRDLADCQAKGIIVICQDRGKITALKRFCKKVKLGQSQLRKVQVWGLLSFRGHN